jgi:YbbR domain-containing protein
MKKIIFFLLIALSLSITSCNRDEDEVLNKPTANYTFSFICYEEVIELLEVEILDNNNNVIVTKQFYNVTKSQAVNYAFNVGNKIKIKVNDENYFHTFYTIKKNGNILYDSYVLDGYIYNDVIEQL